MVIDENSENQVEVSEVVNLESSLQEYERVLELRDKEIKKVNKKKNKYYINNF